MLVKPVLCDGVAVMSSRSSCSHMYTVLSTRPHGVVLFGVDVFIVLPLMAYGHPFILPLW